MHRTLVLLVTSLIPTLTCAATQQPDDAVPHGQLPDTVVPTRYALDLTIDPRQAGFSGTETITIEVREPTDRIFMHGLNLVIGTAIARSGDREIPARFEIVEPVTGVARLDLEEPLPAGTAELDFSWTGSFNDGAEGLFLATVGEDRYVFSQMQAIDARRVFPSFDEPRFKTPFDVTVRAIPGDEVITNTPLVGTAKAENGLAVHRYASTEPLPTYLLAFAVGPLDVVAASPLPPDEVRKRPVPLRAAATRGNGPRLEYALKHTPFMVEHLERYFGLAYPYAKLDLISSPQMSGAMENAGAILYDDNLLLLGDDPTPTQRRSYGETHAHELAHQWFGDLVTPVWWDDIWLNESFAEWMGVKVAAQWDPQLGSEVGLTASALDTMTTDSLLAGRPIRQTVTDNTQIASTFDSITYLKGAGVLAMFESYLGEDTFRKGVRLHLGRHLHGNATADDFFGAIAEASGDERVVGAFRSFVEQPGVPLIEVKRSAAGDALTLAQTRYRPIGSALPETGLWQVPFCAKLYDGDRAEKRCTLLDSRTGKIELPAATGAVMPNADGAGYYRFALDPGSVDALLEIAGKLPDREALTLADSLAAAFRAGRLPFDKLVAAAAILAKHPNRQASISLGYELVEIANSWLDDADRDRIAATLREIYEPRLGALGFVPRAGAHAGDSSERRLLRRSIVALLALHARDPQLRATLARAAEASLTDPKAIDPEYRDIAWAIGVQDLPPEFARTLRERLLASEDAAQRTDMALALGYAEREADAAASLELALDPKIRAGELFRIVYQQLYRAPTRDTAWSWFANNFDAIANKLPGFAQAAMVGLPGSFCDAAHRRAVEATLGPAVERTGLGTLELERTLERIDLCIAQDAALGKDVRAALAGRG
jgi:aminopeptidase N